MKRFFLVGGLLILIISAVYCVVFLVENLSSLPSLDWTSPRIYLSFSGAVGAYLVSLMVSFATWHLILRAVGEKSAVVAALGIGMISQFAKYVPGNVAHLIGRIALAQRYGFGSVRVGLSMAIEIGGAALAGFTIAAFAFVIEGPPRLAGASQLPSPLVLALFASGSAIVALVAAQVLKRWRPEFLRRQLDQAAVSAPRATTLVICFLLYLLVFLILGLMLYLVVRGVFDGTPAPYWLLAGVFALAWVAGFLTPGAPGGLGVREALLLVSLDPLYGAGPALGMTIGLRIVTTVGDILALLVGFLFHRLARPGSGVRTGTSVLEE